MENPVLLGLSGKWRDKHYKNGDLVFETDVLSNQIQDQAFNTISALLLNQFVEGAQPIETLQVFGITHIEYGSGSPEWDAVSPSKPTSQAYLTNAVLRQTISSDRISFVPTDDPFGGSATSLTPTNRIRITCTIGELEYSGELREFGLFCRYGASSDALNTGLIFNWVTHPLINKDDSITIERVIEITITRG